MTFLPMETPKTFAHRLAAAQRQAWLPPTLLLLALSSVFLFGGDRGYFYRDEIHNWHSAKNLTIADNLSSEHHFLMFDYQTLDADGELTYEPYNRFPIGGFALTKLAILPFGEDLSAKIYAARMLTLLFFAAAAFLAYLSLSRLFTSRWIALTATLLAFSSTYCLYYNDLIQTETIIDLFAIMLVFHAIAIFEQEGRFRQILAKTCIALLLGWHAYALLLPFIAFGLTREFTKSRSSVPDHHLALRQLKHSARSLLRSRYLTLGATALLFGVSLLTVNFTNEYFALNREVPFTETPSFQSMIYRTGVGSFLKESRADYLSWPAFTERQFYRVGLMSLPYAFSPTHKEPIVYGDGSVDRQPSFSFVILGITAFGASLIGLLFARRHKILLAILALSGFCWALPMRHNTAYPGHDFEAVFYIGVTLTLFSLILLYLRNLRSERLVAALSVAALLVFVASALRMAHLNNANQDLEIHQATIADMRLIREMSKGKTTEVVPNKNWGGAVASQYYFSGRTIIPERANLSDAHKADFALSFTRIDVPALLTPDNRRVYLYDAAAYIKQIHEIIERSNDAQSIRSNFDVHLNGQILIYSKNACGEEDVSERFFLALYPVDENDLPAESRQHGFHNLDFYFFEDLSVQSGERCIAIMTLPDYDLARIYTGQYIQRADGSTAHLWEGEIHLAEAAR